MKWLIHGDVLQVVARLLVALGLALAGALSDGALNDGRLAEAGAGLAQSASK